jgi:hypothetical protein
MKKEISPPMMIAAIVVAVLILGLIGWQVFSPPSQASGSPDMLKAAQARKAAREGDTKR